MYGIEIKKLTCRICGWIDCQSGQEGVDLKLDEWGMNLQCSNCPEFHPDFSGGVRVGERKCHAKPIHHPRCPRCGGKAKQGGEQK